MHGRGAQTFHFKGQLEEIDMVDPKFSDIFVETIPLNGGYGNSGVHVVRGVGTIPASAEKFFNFQTSRTGYQSIDEYLVNHRNLDNFKWLTRPEFNDIEKPPATEGWPDESPYQLMMNRVE